MRRGIVYLLGALAAAALLLPIAIVLAEAAGRTSARQFYVGVSTLPAVVGLIGLHTCASRPAIILGWLLAAMIVMRTLLELCGLPAAGSAWMVVGMSVIFALAAGSLLHGFSSFAEASGDAGLVRWNRRARRIFVVSSVVLSSLFVIELPTARAARGALFLANGIIILATAELLTRWYRATRVVVPSDCEPRQTSASRKVPRGERAGP